jgi:hypothetical protein
MRWSGAQALKSPRISVEQFISLRAMLRQFCDRPKEFPANDACSTASNRRLMRSKFSGAEDAQLRSIVLNCRKCDWQEISSQMAGRTARQCKERWMNYLSPKLNIREWRPEEDEQLIKKYSHYGNRWTKIAAFFPRRTDGMVKNRFNKLQRRSTCEYKRQFLANPEFHTHMPRQRPVPSIGPYMYQTAPEDQELQLPEVLAGHASATSDVDEAEMSIDSFGFDFFDVEIS